MAHGPFKSHRHIMLEDKGDGTFNMYRMEFVKIVSESECGNLLDEADMTPSGKPRGGTRRATGKGSRGSRGKLRGDIMAQLVRSSSIELEGEGYKLNIGSGNFIRNTDPRIYAIAFERNPDRLEYPHLRRFTKEGSKEKLVNHIMFADESGRPNDLRFNPRLIHKPGDGVTEEYTEDYWTWRIADRNRRPSDFDLNSIIALHVFDNSGKYTGVKLIVANRTSPAKYRQLDDVFEYVDSGQAETVTE